MSMEFFGNLHGADKRGRGGPVSRVLSGGEGPPGGPFLSDARRPASPATYPGVITDRANPPKPARLAARSAALPPYLVLLPVGFAEPGRSPGLLVSSYLAVSPLPRRPGPPRRFV